MLGVCVNPPSLSFFCHMPSMASAALVLLSFFALCHASARAQTEEDAAICGLSAEAVAGVEQAVALAFAMDAAYPPEDVLLSLSGKLEEVGVNAHRIAAERARDVDKRRLCDDEVRPKCADALKQGPPPPWSSVENGQLNDEYWACYLEVGECPAKSGELDKKLRSVEEQYGVFLPAVKTVRDMSCDQRRCVKVELVRRLWRSADEGVEEEEKAKIFVVEA